MSKIHTITCHTFAVAILSLLPNSAWAQSTVTWDAGTDLNWDTTTSNWTGTTYTNGDDAQFLGAGAGTVTLSGTITPNTVLVNSANDYEFSGVISGGGSLTKDGSGILTLSSQNTYSGGTTVNNGTLDLVGQQIIDGTLTVDGSSSVVKLSGTSNNATIGITSITVQNGGTFTDNTAGSLVQSLNSPVTFNNGGTITSEAGSDGSSGWGNFLFNGAINVTGTGLATISSNGMSIGFSKTVTVADTVAGAGTDLLITSSIRPNYLGTITKEGAGTVELTANDSNDTSPWVINNGTLKFNSAEAFGSSGTLSASSGITVNSGGTLDVANQWNTAENGALTINGGVLNFSSGTDTNFVNNLTLNDGATVSASTGSDGFRAGYFRDATITVGGSSASTISSKLLLADNGGVRKVTFNVADVTSSADADLTMSGVISDLSGFAGAGLIKTGAGTLTLSNRNNSYTGGTTVDNGILSLNGTNRAVSLIGTGTLTINDGAQVDAYVNAFGWTYQNAIVINGGILNSAAGDSHINTVEMTGGQITGSQFNPHGDFTINASPDQALISSKVSLSAGIDFNVGDGAQASDLLVSGVISGTGKALSKSGAGTMTLTAQNTYTGGTTVNDGTLDLVGQGIIDGALTVDGSSSLVKLSATGNNGMQPLDSLTLSNGGTFTDNGPAGGLHTVNSSVTFDGGGTISSEVTGNGGYGNFLFANGINVTGTPGLATIDAHSISFNFGETITVADSVAGSGTDLLISSSIRNERVGTITKNGTGKVTLTGANVDTSAWTINDGNVEVQNGSAIGDAAAVSVNSNGTFEVDNNETIGRIGGAGNVVLNANLTTGDATNTEISGNISGSGGLVKQGASTLTLSGDNSAFSGGITLQDNNSTLALNSANAAGTGDLAFNGFQTKLYNGASGPSTINNNISTAGWFYWESGSKALEITGDWSNSSQVVWTNSANTLTMSGVVSGTASTGFYGNGTIALTNANNTYTGNYNATLDSTIQFNTIANKSVNSSLGAGTQIIFDLASNQNFNGTFENIGVGGSTNRDVILGQHNGTPWARIDNNGTGALDFNGTFENRSNAGATRELRLGGDYNGENTISSNLSDGANGGKLALTKDGDTTWTLSGTNTYTGDTKVNAGKLIINGDHSAATGAITVSGTGVLGGSGTLGSMTVSMGGAMSPGNSPGTQTIANLTWGDGGSYIWEVNDSNGTQGADTGWDWIDVTTSFDLSGLSAGGFTIDIDSLTTGNDAGLAAGFDYAGLAYGDPFATTFTILTLDSGSITGFDAGDFVFDTSGFANGKLEWSIAATGSDLVLSAVFVPEPSSTALLGLGLSSLLLRRRRS